MISISNPLARFLGSYLHQDWDLDYSDPAAAAADFGGTDSPSDVLAALGQIAVAIASDANEQDLREAILRHASYVPHPDSRSWLSHLSTVMAHAYAGRADIEPETLSVPVVISPHRDRGSHEADQ